MNDIRVPIQIIVGDARNYSGDALVIGAHNPVRDWVIAQTGGEFESLDIPDRSLAAPHSEVRAECTQSNALPWPIVVSLKSRIARPLGLRIADDVSSVLAFLHRERSVREFVVVPVSWREPATIAFNTLLAFWRLAYFSFLMVGLEQFEGAFKIVTNDSAEPFRELLENGGRGFYEKADALKLPMRVRLFRTAKDDLSRVQFEMSLDGPPTGAASQ